jgi:hypothetical protein
LHRHSPLGATAGLIQASVQNVDFLHKKLFSPFEGMGKNSLIGFDLRIEKVRYRGFIQALRHAILHCVLNHLCLSWRIFHGLAAIPLCQCYLLSDDKSMRRRFHQRLKLLYGILRIRRAYPAKREGDLQPLISNY